MPELRPPLVQVLQQLLPCQAWQILVQLVGLPPRARALRLGALEVIEVRLAAVGRTPVGVVRSAAARRLPLPANTHAAVGAGG